MNTAISYSDGVLEIHDTAAALEVLRYGLCASNYARSQKVAYLSLATAISTGQHFLGAEHPRLIEQLAVKTAIRNIRRGDDGFFRTMAAYGAMMAPRQQDVLAEMLLSATPAMVLHTLTAEHPIRYLRGALAIRMDADQHQEPQDPTEPLEQHAAAIDQRLPEAAIAAAGINLQDLADDVRRRYDRELSDDLLLWAHGAGWRDLGKTRWRRLMEFLRGDAREVAMDHLVPVVGMGFMCAPTWLFTSGTRLDSVWHRRNLPMVR